MYLSVITAKPEYLALQLWYFVVGLQTAVAAFDGWV